VRINSLKPKWRSMLRPISVILLMLLVSERVDQVEEKALKLSDSPFNELSGLTSVRAFCEAYSA
jgi:hypothetical protein